MKERVFVCVNGVGVEVFRGMVVKHALIACDYALYEACLEGRATVRDRHGFVVGLDGALEEGYQLFVKKEEERKG
jgi:hypothetical protein